MIEMESCTDSGEKPRLLFLTQWFDPEPTIKGALFAKALQARGFEVEVITGFPNYPGGTIYPGYRVRLVHRETVDGIAITRLPLYPSHDQSALGRIANYVSFFISVIIYLTLFARRADIIYIYHPPLTVGLAAACAQLYRRTPTVIDMQDMWPDTLRATGMIGSTRILWAVDLLCNWLYRSVSHIVVLSPGFRKLLLSRGVPEDKISVIYNWADELSLAPETNIKPSLMASPDKFRVLFAGNMGKAQSLDNVLNAAKIVMKSRHDVEFVFLGGGLEAHNLKKRAEREQIPNVSFLPQVPMAEVGKYVAAADCALVHLRSDPLFSITIPSKTQAYMAAAKPIIIAVDGDAADIVRQSGCGIVVPPDTPDELADAVCDLASRSQAERSRLGHAAFQFYSENLSLAKGADRFAEIFRHLILVNASQ
jgi:colanic acid biosynthesis glycosyl transferase WcaI